MSLSIAILESVVSVGGIVKSAPREEDEYADERGGRSTHGDDIPKSRGSTRYRPQHRARRRGWQSRFYALGEAALKRRAK